MHNIDWKKEILTIPNLLSLFRLLLIPVYVTVYLNATESWQYTLCAVILAISCLTDMADGYIARHFNMISTVGKILDPVADKFTQLAMTLCLAARYPVMGMVVFLFLCKEIFQTIALALNLRKGKMLDGALISGKICTTVLFTSFVLLVLIPAMDIYYVNLLAILDMVWLLIAFGDYAMAYYGPEPMVKDLKPITKDQE